MSKNLRALYVLIFSWTGKVQTQPAPVLRQKLRTVFRRVVTQNHNVTRSVCTDSEPGMGQERGGEGGGSLGRGIPAGSKGSATARLGGCVSCNPGLWLQPNIKAEAAGREHVEALHSHREKLWGNVAQGQSWAGKETLAAQTETPLGRTVGTWCYILRAQGLSPVGKLFLFLLAQK